MTSIQNKILVHTAILHLDAHKHNAILRNDNDTIAGIAPFLSALRKYYGTFFS